MNNQQLGATLQRLALNDSQFNQDAAAWLQANGVRAGGRTPGEAFLNHLAATVPDPVATFSQVAGIYAPGQAPAAAAAPSRPAPAPAMSPEEKRLHYLEKVKVDDVFKKLPAGSPLRRLANDPQFNAKMEAKLQQAGTTPLPHYNAAQSVIVRGMQLAEDMEKKGHDPTAIGAAIEKMTGGAFSKRDVRNLVETIGGEREREVGLAGMNSRFEEREKEREEHKAEQQKALIERLSPNEKAELEYENKRRAKDREERDDRRADIAAEWDAQAADSPKPETHVAQTGWRDHLERSLARVEGRPYDHQVEGQAREELREELKEDHGDAASGW